MDLMECITFVVAVNNNEIYESNFFASPLFHGNHCYQILPQRNFQSASQAYNAGINQAKNDLIIFVHQDVFFPEDWIADLENALRYLETEDPAWGVLGCFGSAKNRPGGVGRVYTTGLGIHGNKIDNPERVETLDEIVLMIRKSSGLRFDPDLPYFHMYGADICMSARDRGMKCYAIPAFCIHNTKQILEYPKEFVECYRHIKSKWKKYLPIYTSCIIISRFNRDVYMMRIKKIYRKLFGKSISAECRAEDPRALLKHL